MLSKVILASPLCLSVSVAFSCFQFNFEEFFPSCLCSHSILISVPLRPPVPLNEHNGAGTEYGVSILSLLLFNLYAKEIFWNAGLADCE